MPIVSTAETLIQMTEGAVPEIVKGKLVKIWPQKQNSNGLMQKGTLAGTNGQSIEIVFSDRAEIPKDLIGKELYATAKAGPRGLSGLKRRTNEWPKGKFTPQIWVYDGADLAWDNPPASGDQSQQQPQHQQPQNQPPQNNTPPPQQQNANPPQNTTPPPQNQSTTTPPAQHATPPVAPAGVAISRLVYRETRQPKQYESIHMEAEAIVPPGGKVGDTYKFLRDSVRYMLDNAMRHAAKK